MTKINKANLTGLTKAKKEILKSAKGCASSSLDLNKVRDALKYEKN